MAGVRTYVSSFTYDTLLNIMYPDDHEKERPVQEVERLIVQGHTVEYRFGNNMSTVLDMDKFNEYVRPKYTDEPAPSNIQEVLFQNELDNLTPVAPEPEKINLEQNSMASVNLTPLQPLEPKKVEEEKVEEKATEEAKVEQPESTEENKEETTEEKPKSSIKPEEKAGKQKKGGKE